MNPYGITFKQKHYCFLLDLTITFSNVHNNKQKLYMFYKIKEIQRIANKYIFWNFMIYAFIIAVM